MGTSASRAIMARIRQNAWAVLLTALMSLALVPAEALAFDDRAQQEAAAEIASDATSDQTKSDAEETAEPRAGAIVSPTISLATALQGEPSSFVSTDVMLGDDSNAQVVVGSFTVDGLTFSFSVDGVTLVAVAPGTFGVDGPDGGRGEVGTSEPGAPSSPSAIPASVSYGDAAYDVTAIAPYAFYLSGATEVALPDTIASVDGRAFRSSDVAWVDVDPENPALASFDGALYSADLSSLLLIPEGRAGSVSIPCEAEVVQASKFSHCSLVDAISVDGDGAAFASWDGLLYDGAGTTLLRVPAGATDITIREGCATIAAGAMEGCAKLESISAPSTVTSISSEVFSQETPTVSLPAAALVEGTDSSGEEGTSSFSQLTAMVALTAGSDPAPKADPAAITVALPDDAPVAPWQRASFKVEGGAADASAQPLAVSIHSEDVALRSDDLVSDMEEGDDPEEGLDLPAASLGTAETYAGAYDFTIVNAEGSTLYQTNSSGTTSTPIDSKVISCGDSSHQVHVRFLDKNGSLIVQLWHSATTDNSYYRWVKPGYVLVGVKVTNGAGTVTDEIRASAVGTNYTGSSKITGAGRTIAPIFEKVTYNVTLNSNGATTAGTTSVSVQYGQAMPAITVPIKAGGRFLGYFSTASSAGGTQYYDEFGKSAHVWDQYEAYPTSLSTIVTYTIYARWLSGVYDAIYVPGSKVASTKLEYGNRPQSGGTTTYYATSTITGGITIAGTDLWHSSGNRISLFRGVYDGNLGSVLLTATPKDGYSITEWWWGNTSTKVPKGQSNFFKASTQFGPIVTANKYDVSFNANNGSGGQSTAVSATYDAAMPAISTDKPVRAGYRFMGWYDNANYAATGAKQYYNAACLSARSWDKAKAATLYAGWKQMPIITFDGNGGIAERRSYKNSVISTVLQSGATVAVSSDYYKTHTPNQNIFVYPREAPIVGDDFMSATRAGYTWQGWATSKTGTPLAKESKTISISANMTLYAIWTANAYRLTFDGNGGTVERYNTHPTTSVYELAETAATVSTTSTTVRSHTRNFNVFANPKDTSKSREDWFTAKRAGYTWAGWSTERSGGAVLGGENGKSETIKLVANTTYYAQWTGNAYMVTLDQQQGLGGTTEVKATMGAAMPSITIPARVGYAFRGYYASPDGGGTQYYTWSGASAHDWDIPNDAVLYANWTKCGPRITVHVPNGTLWRLYSFDGVYRENDPAEYKLNSWTPAVPVNTVRFYNDAVESQGFRMNSDTEVSGRLQGYKYGLNSSIGGVTAAWMVAEQADGTFCGAAMANKADWVDITECKSVNIYLNNCVTYAVTWDANGGECDTAITSDVMPYDTVVAPEPKRTGYVFQGWYDGDGADAELACKAGERTPQISANTTYYAHWEPALRVDAPIDATVRVDLLGVEEQVEEERSYLESRSGAALKVDSVSFEPKQGADELFGERVADVFLEAMAGGSVSADYRFALDAAATESDPDRLAPFALPDGYGTRIYVAYRFAIPDDVLAAIDPSRFEQQTTAVCQVIYTVALAS